LKNETVPDIGSVEVVNMSRHLQVTFLAAFAAASAAPVAGLAAPSPSPAPIGSPSALPANKDAGMIDGVVTGVDYTPGKSKMVVKAAAQTFTFAVNPGTNVVGPFRDFTTDIKVGTRVSVSASKALSAGQTTYTAQIITVVPAAPAHAAH
jgi:hypothetical protein